MENTSIGTAPSNLSSSFTEDSPSKSAGIAFCSVYALEAVLITGGNLLTVVLFALNRNLRKKSLFQVINMSFADLMLGAVSLPIYIYIEGGIYRLWQTTLPDVFSFTFFTIDGILSQVSFISAVFISFERFYAIYWPLKHRSLSSGKYCIVIFLTWTTGVLISSTLTIIAILFSYKHAFLFWVPYVSTLLFIVCGCNIAIWRKFRYGSVASKQQNRTLQNKRLTKTLLLVSALSLLSWVPFIIMNTLRNISTNYYPHLYTVSNILNYSNSLLNPVVYALRIPEFREAMGICRLKRTSVINIDNNKRQDTRATGMTSLTQPSALTTDPCHLNIAYEQDREDIMDTKL